MISNIVAPIFAKNVGGRGFAKFLELTKKGDPKHCYIFPEITLLPIPSKLTSRIIFARISDAVNAILRENQLGFRENCFCIDLVNSVRVNLEKCYEFRSPISWCL